MGMPMIYIDIECGKEKANKILYTIWSEHRETMKGLISYFYIGSHLRIVLFSTTNIPKGKIEGIDLEMIPFSQFTLGAEY